MSITCFIRVYALSFFHHFQVSCREFVPHSLCGSTALSFHHEKYGIHHMLLFSVSAVPYILPANSLQSVSSPDRDRQMLSLQPYVKLYRSHVRQDISLNTLTYGMRYKVVDDMRFQHGNLRHTLFCRLDFHG